MTRPLAHLGIGASSADFELCSINEELYDELFDRGEQLIQDAEKAYMGHYYDNPPVPTFKELRKQLEDRITRIEKLVALKAPKEILQAEDIIAVRLHRDIKNKNYGSLSDPDYKQYLEAYRKKENDWHNSKEKETILNEIYAYNEAEYNNYKSQQKMINKEII